MVSLNLIIALGLLIAFIVAAPKLKDILGEISNGGKPMDEAQAVEQILSSQKEMMGGITSNGRRIGNIVGGGTDIQGSFNLIKTNGVTKVRT